MATRHLDEKVAQQFAELLELGKQVVESVSKRRNTSIHGGGPRYILDDLCYVDSVIHQKWRVRALGFLDRFMSKKSEYYLSFYRLSGSTYYGLTKQAMAVLEAAHDDFIGGYLINTRRLIEAEVFEDFLEQAEHLLETKYEGPAAVIAGCVLEDGLRKLCERRGVALPDKPKLDWMNAQLTKSGVYNSLVQKQVTALADLRNKAAHGQWDEFTQSDVEQMIIQVRSIMAAHFT